MFFTVEQFLRASLTYLKIWIIACECNEGESVSDEGRMRCALIARHPLPIIVGFMTCSNGRLYGYH